MMSFFSIIYCIKTLQKAIHKNQATYNRKQQHKQTRQGQEESNELIINKKNIEFNNQIHERWTIWSWNDHRQGWKLW